MAGSIAKKAMTESPRIPPDLQACLLCDDVRREANGKFILIGLFDTIGAQSFPMTYPRLCIVTRWCSGQGEFHQQSRVVTPDQRETLVNGQPIPVRLPNPEATVTNVEFFLNVNFREPGTHWIEILLDGDLRLRFPLNVQRMAHPPPAF